MKKSSPPPTTLCSVFHVTPKSALNTLIGRICHGHSPFFTGNFSESFTGQCQIFKDIISKIVTGIVAKVTGIFSKKAIFATGFDKNLPVNL